MSPPQHVGHYRVLRLLGEGAMGQVYEAAHETLDRRVAIKLLHRDTPENDSPQRLHRFLREAGLLARIDHPGVVRLYDYGHLPDETPYLVMELLHGETLRQRMSRVRRLDVPVVVALGRELAAALSHVHAAGAIHRDVKPENVMLSPGPGGTERARLFDFGIAYDDSPVLPPALTKLETGDQVLLGTALYMSPEQARSEQITARVDVYALGLVLYEALSGDLPCPRQAMRALSFHVSPEPAAPLPPDVNRPRWLDELLARMLQKAPSSRASMDQVFAELGHPPPTWTRLLRRWSPTRLSLGRALRRRAPGVAVAGLLALLIAAGQWRELVLSRAESDIARTDRELARRAGTADLRLRQLRELAPQLRRLAWLDRQAAWDLAHLYHRLSDVEMGSGSMLEARRHQDEAAHLLHTWPGRGSLADPRYQRRLIELDYWEGGLAKQEGRLNRAAEAYERALRVARTQSGEEAALARAKALEGLGEVRWHLGQTSTATAHWAEALTTQEGLLAKERDPEKLLYGSYLRSFLKQRLGLAAEQARDLRAARAHLDDAVAIMQPLVPDGAQQDTATGVTQVHGILYTWQLAEALLERGLLRWHLHEPDAANDLSRALELAQRAADVDGSHRYRLTLSRCLLALAEVPGSKTAAHLTQGLQILRARSEDGMFQHALLTYLLARGDAEAGVVRAALDREGRLLGDVHVPARGGIEVMAQGLLTRPDGAVPMSRRSP